jgi:para-aminobenzoate synthetase component 1
MQRTSKHITLKDTESFKLSILNWAQQFEQAIWLDSNNYNQQFSNFDAVLAVDGVSTLKCNYKNAFEKLKDFQTKTNDYIFGYLSYDLKNDLENLESNNFDGLLFPDLFFFQPKKLFLFKNNEVQICYLLPFKHEIESDLAQILSEKKSVNVVKQGTPKIKLRIQKNEYFEKVSDLLNHIHRGDIYEANFCQEFYSENCSINPLEVYNSLNNISKPPFATFLKVENLYLLSASPERFLKKQDTVVISQPIKGTEKRAKNKLLDNDLKTNLEQNPKERAENIMIVDLVRNDFSKIAKKGTVTVNELCKAYTFKQVHQLISTISCEVSKNTHPVEIIKSTFPMGSMTGAPKISAMQLIEKLEQTKRGVYSGAVGYFMPNGDFDFNVIIRSILYNSSNKYLSFSVGSAITAGSVAEKEYQECLLKAKAMRKVLSATE